MILSTNYGIDIMSKKMSADPTYIIIVHEDGYAIKNVIQDKLLTLYRDKFDAEKDLEFILKRP